MACHIFQRRFSDCSKKWSGNKQATEKRKTNDARLLYKASDFIDARSRTWDHYMSKMASGALIWAISTLILYLLQYYGDDDLHPFTVAEAVWYTFWITTEAAITWMAWRVYADMSSSKIA